MKFILFILLALSSAICSAQVYVSGYTRSNGTYVQPHIRSSPDSVKWNNYGSSGSSYSDPSSRDLDGDGIANMNDFDDDNDGIDDDSEI